MKTICRPALVHALLGGEGHPYLEDEPAHINQEILPICVFESDWIDEAAEHDGRTAPELEPGQTLGSDVEREYFNLPPQSAFALT